MAQPAPAAFVKKPRHPWVEKDVAIVPDESRTALRDAMAREHVPAGEYDDYLWLMAQESEGIVNQPNPSSSARGLYQLLQAQYGLNPHGAQSFGNAVEEAQGGIRYVRGRYGNAAAAKAFWLLHKWY